MPRITVTSESHRKSNYPVETNEEARHVFLLAITTFSQRSKLVSNTKYTTDYRNKKEIEQRGENISFYYFPSYFPTWFPEVCSVDVHSSLLGTVCLFSPFLFSALFVISLGERYKDVIKN